MKRIIITANSDSMRAFRLASTFVEDHFEFDVSEIDLPFEAAAAWPWQDLENRLGTMGRCVDELITAEDPESWTVAAPLGVLAYLLPSVKSSVKNRLAGVKIEDLTALPASRIARRFAPSAATGAAAAAA
jgi:hypothetical protein